MNWTINRVVFVALALGCLLLNGCGIYSFNGATIDYNTTKTISITNLYNDTPNGPANLSQRFTEKLRDYFQQNTNLLIVNEEGDLQLDGKIVSYETQDVAPTTAINPDQTDLSSITKLTITLQCTYQNVNDDEFDFENKSFSFFANFNNTQNALADVEQELIEEISDQIIIDIFNATVANW